MEFYLADLAALAVYAISSLFLYLLAKEQGRFAVFTRPGAGHPFKCPICAYVYIFEQESELSTCPRCSSLNRKDDLST